MFEDLNPQEPNGRQKKEPGSWPRMLSEILRFAACFRAVLSNERCIFVREAHVY